MRGGVRRCTRAVAARSSRTSSCAGHAQPPFFQFDLAENRGLIPTGFGRKKGGLFHRFSPSPNYFSPVQFSRNQPRNQPPFFHRNRAVNQPDLYSKSRVDFGPPKTAENRRLTTLATPRSGESRFRPQRARRPLTLAPPLAHYAEACAPETRDVPGVASRASCATPFLFYKSGMLTSTKGQYAYGQRALCGRGSPVLANIFKCKSAQSTGDVTLTRQRKAV
jgi:hypothetical protein